MSNRQIVSREVWYALPPLPGQSDHDLQWGYLEFYTNGEVIFNTQRPSVQEIEQRKSCLFDQPYKGTAHEYSKKQATRSQNT